MVDFKLVLNDIKTGKSYNREVKDDMARGLMDKVIGDSVQGDTFDMPGYEFEITGGSDNCGFPMRRDVDTARKKILTVEGVGVKKKHDGIRQRKTVCGSKIHSSIVQVNMKITKHGKAKLDEGAEAQNPESVSEAANAGETESKKKESTEEK